MGCDIHWHVERLENGTWKRVPSTGVETWNYTGQRNYDVFDVMAEARGGTGGYRPWDHSHNWFTVQELLDYDWTQPGKHTDEPAGEACDYFVGTVSFDN